MFLVDESEMVSYKKYTKNNVSLISNIYSNKLYNAMRLYQNFLITLCR